MANRAEVFVQHIEEHLRDLKIKGKVLCKICGKDIDQIFEDEKIRFIKHYHKSKKSEEK